MFKCYFILKLRFSSVVKPAQNVTHAALFAVQSPAWGIHFFALLVFALLLQVMTVGIKMISSGHTSDKLMKNSPYTNKRVEELTTISDTLHRCFHPLNQSRGPTSSGNPPPAPIKKKKKKKCWAVRGSNKKAGKSDSNQIQIQSTLIIP